MMILKEYQQQAKKRLEKGTKYSLDFLSEHVLKCSDAYNHLVEIKARFAELKGKFGSGVIDYEVYSRHSNQIRGCVLAFVDQLEVDDFKKEEALTSFREVGKESEIAVNEDTEELPEMSVTPAVFFDVRFGKAFPGMRGLNWINDPAEAAYRLSLLLKKPLNFTPIRHAARPDPIWRFRGFQSSNVYSFRMLTDTKCLLNGFEEMEVSRIAVYENRSHYRHFVYVEASPDRGYGLGEDDIMEQISDQGYAYEEYGIMNGHVVTREEYDDGAFVLGGRVVEKKGEAELRKRYLSKYNFILSSINAPWGTRKQDRHTASIFDDIIVGNKSIEDLAAILNSLPPNKPY